jgi:hypothetical protein
MEIASPLPTGAPARVRLSCSPAFRWERQRAATAAAPLRRRQGSTSARRAPLRPTFSPHPAGRARLVLPAGDLAAGGNVLEPMAGRRQGLAGTFV